MAQFTLDGVTYSKFRDIPGAVYTRSGVEYQQNAAGVWTPFDDDTPPVSAGVGVDVWEARTNSIRNPTGLGGAAGVWPTNWSGSAADGLAGITGTPQGIGTEFGLPYVDVRFTGTVTTTGDYQIRPETPTTIAALSGEVWTSAVYARVVSGGDADVRIDVIEGTAAGGFVAGSVSNPLVVSNSLKRVSHERTLSGGGTVARVWTDIRVYFLTPGEVVDRVVRFYGPQLKKGADIADPPILQTTNAATRGAPSMYLNAPGLIVPSLGVTVVVDVTWPRTLTTTGIFVEPYNAGSGIPTAFSLSSTGDGTRPRLFVRQGSNRVDTGGSGPVVTRGSRFKMAISFDASGGIVSAGGATLTSQQVVTQSDYAGEPISIGSRLGGSLFMNGAINSVSFLKGLRTQAELNALTA